MVVNHATNGSYSISATADLMGQATDPTPADNTAAYPYYVRFAGRGNLVVSNLQFFDNPEATTPIPGNTFTVGQSVIAKGTLVKQSGTFNNPVALAFSYGDPLKPGALFASPADPHPGPLQATQVISYPITFDRVYTGDVFIAANLEPTEQLESNPLDNKAGRTIQVLPAGAAAGGPLGHQLARWEFQRAHAGHCLPQQRGGGRCPAEGANRQRG